jgi:hypothetical protein
MRARLLGRLHKTLKRLRTAYFVQSKPNMWNVVVIIEMRHEHQTFPTSAIKRFAAYNRDVRDAELIVIVVFMCRNRDI